MSDECFLVFMDLWLQIHLGNFFSLMFPNHGLSVWMVSKMCSIECGDGVFSYGSMPVSTP
jgi:hypothetical protein